MPLYFFNLRHGRGLGKLAVDLEGDDLADAQAAHSHALVAARDLIARTRSHSVRDWHACSFEIADAVGRPVLTVPFSETVQDDSGH